MARKAVSMPVSYCNSSSLSSNSTLSNPRVKTVGESDSSVVAVEILNSSDIRGAERLFIEDIMTLELKAGKIYVDNDGYKWKIIKEYTDFVVAEYVDSSLSGGDFRPFNRTSNRDVLYDNRTLVKEYVEPVVHKYDIIWWKTPSSEVFCGAYRHGYRLLNTGSIELKRQTVEFIEEK